MALLLAFGAPAPAEARGSVLVGNNLIADPPLQLDFKRDRAQAFTTGSVSDGYTLTSVQIGVATGGSPANYTMKIVSAGASGPGAQVIGTLNPPTSLRPGIANSFTGSVDLDASTTYYIVLDLKTSHGAVQLKATQSVQENPDSAAGWSIGNSSNKRNVDDSGSWTGDHTLKVIMSGYSRAVPVLDRAAIDGATLVLNYDNDLDAASGTAAGQFAIKADGGVGRAATGISISGRQVTLTAPRVAPGQTVTVSYAKPGTSRLKGVNQLEVGGFSDHAVTNNTRPLVSNTGQAVGSPINDSYDQAQAFTTGTNAGGYKLTSIAVRLLFRSAHTDWDVQLWSSSGTKPGSLLATLNKPASVTDGLNIFWASGTGIDLAAYTTYWFVWNNHSVADQVRMYVIDTGSQAEDWGGAPGWSIGDRGHLRMALSTGSDWKFTRNRMISVHGYSKQGRTGTVPGGFPGGGGGGGGGGPSGPSPSTLDYEWTVKRDIEALVRGNDTPTGMWSDGTTLWLADNGQGADDEVYAYDIESGERAADREFALAETNRAPRGVWSDGKTVWVSDSGRDHVFAYDLASGGRLEAREVALATVNPDARGIWSDGEFLWVLDGRANALFAYDLESGRLLAHYELDARNGDARGIWSDGMTVWVSDHGAKILFAYRLPELPRGEGQAASNHLPEPLPLERVSDEEFTHLSSSSNNSPRGIWSDGDVMYVVDASDGKVYTYNMPDAIDARLASLSLSGVEIGAFDSARTESDATHDGTITVTTVQAEAVQRRTTVVIAPPDADEAVDGHQVALQGLEAITVTVTSADGSRTRVYRVGLAETQCLRGAVAEGFSLLVYEGGSVDDLDACARDRAIVALYALHAGVYVAYIPDAPEFVNGPFRELFAGGVPAYTPLLAASSGPPSADPAASANAGLPWSECLRGAIADGFSAAVYEGGSVEALAACASRRGVTAFYALGDGGWVSYIVGGTESVNRPFAELFPDGVPAVTPLVVRSDGPPAATAPGSGGDN